MNFPGTGRVTHLRGEVGLLPQLFKGFHLRMAGKFHRPLPHEQAGARPGRIPAVSKVWINIDGL